MSSLRGACLIAGLIAAMPAQADEIIALETRPGVTQSFSLWEPYPAKPATVIVLFPGAGGKLLPEGPRREASNPHLFWQPREALARPQVAVAVVDSPSDQDGMGEEFRQSAEHATDMRSVASELRRRFPGARLVVMGHSRGTVSAGYVARALGEQVAATVLFAGRYHVAPRREGAAPGDPGGTGLTALDLAAWRGRLLLVHHLKDGCGSTPFAEARQWSGRVPMLTVDGPADTRGPYCATGTNHWFAGTERVAADEVFKWLAGEPWKRELSVQP